SVMLVLPFTFSRPHHRGVRLEDRRDGSGDGQAGGCAIGDPCHLLVGPDPPRTAVSGPPDHATSLDALAIGLIDRRKSKVSDRHDRGPAPPVFSIRAGLAGTRVAAVLLRGLLHRTRHPTGLYDGDHGEPGFESGWSTGSNVTLVLAERAHLIRFLGRIRTRSSRPAGTDDEAAVEESLCPEQLLPLRVCDDVRSTRAHGLRPVGWPWPQMSGAAACTRAGTRALSPVGRNQFERAREASQPRRRPRLTHARPYVDMDRTLLRPRLCRGYPDYQCCRRARSPLLWHHLDRPRVCRFVVGVVHDDGLCEPIPHGGSATPAPVAISDVGHRSYGNGGAGFCRR